MIEVKEVFDNNTKAKIGEDILRKLPNWFEVEEAILDYIKGCKEMPFFVAFKNKEAVGFVVFRQITKYSAEIYVMGVLEEYHGRSIGKALIKTCEKYVLNLGVEFLTVKTLASSVKDEYYEKTRLFYEA